MSDLTGRRAALSSIAVGTGRRPDASIIDDAASGLTIIDDRALPPLVLLETPLPDANNVWQFDQAPPTPLGSVPRWTGFLVRLDPAGEASLVRLGDRKVLGEQWDEVVGWLGPNDLAALIARYFGRDAGLEVHHTVVASADAILALIAPGERDRLDLDILRPPLLVRDGSSQSDSRLIFLTSFLETESLSASTPNGLGLCRWTATWGAIHRLDWLPEVVLRGIASIYSG